MAYLRRLGTKRYLVQVSRGTGDNRSKRAEIVQGTRDEALRRAKALRDALDKEREEREAQRNAEHAYGPLLADYLAAFVAETQRQVEAKQRTLSTLSQYRQVVGRVVPLLGHMRLGQITLADLVRLEDEWGASGRKRRDPRGAGSGLTEGTIHNWRAILSRAFRLAHKRGLLGANPYDKMEKPPLPHGDERGAFTLEEGRRFLAALKSLEQEEWRPIWSTALMAGLRLGEVRGLRRQDVDLAQRRLWVRQQITRVRGRDVLGPTKGKRARDVPLTPPLLPILQAHLASHQHELVFAAPDGAPFSVGRARRALALVLKDAGLPPLTPHGLRHSYVTINLAAGVPLEYLSFMVGHAHVSLTRDLYGHYEPVAGARYAEQFGAFLLGDAK